MNILLTGYKGLVGQEVYKQLDKAGHKVFISKFQQEGGKIDLREYKLLSHKMELLKPSHINCVIHCAGLVGGINFNVKNSFQMLYDNAVMGLNIVRLCVEYNIPKLINLGSACIYAKTSIQPFDENDVFKGELEETNQYYSVGKLTVLKAIEAANKQFNTNFYTLMPPNVYGIGDKFDERGHVIPQLLSKFHKLKQISDIEINSVKLQGSNDAVREFIYAKDLAKIIVYFAENVNKSDIANNAVVNVEGEVRTIGGVVNTIQEVVGTNFNVKYSGENEGIKAKVLSPKKFRKLTQNLKLERTLLTDGIQQVYDANKIGLN